MTSTTEPHAARQKKLEDAQWHLECFQAVFLLAGLQPATFRPIPNGYCHQSCCEHLPWYEVQTMKGTIEIGWRKSVINIDWARTGYKVDPKTWGEDLVYPTRGETFIHAHGYAKAVEYLAAFRFTHPHQEYKKDWEARQKK